MVGKKHILTPVTILFSISLLAQTTPPQEHSFKLDVRVVVADVQVVGTKTRAVIAGLQPPDFELYEDGVKQRITSSSQDEFPLSVVFLFDLTDSVQPVLRSLGGEALSALQHLKPGDEVAVMTYSASAHLLQDFTTDRDLAAAAIRKASAVSSEEAAFFNEGLFQAARQFTYSHSPENRHVVVWLTDNVPNIPSEEVRRRYGRSIAAENLHTEADAMAELLRQNATVYTFLQASEISDRMSLSRDAGTILQSLQHPPGSVYKYSAQTGGQVVDATGKKFELLLTGLIDQIRARYSLIYHPSVPQPEGKLCRIRVKLAPGVLQREGKITVRVKQGYYR
ncbi:MAG TPA: VWA domain-containing protein [Alphaproteobacteria bacterium]|nr:VWA domain-containing protein [Alphaproteobacteria bacterium]